MTQDKTNTPAYIVLKSYYSKIDYGLTEKAAAYATVCHEITQSDLMQVYRGNPPEFLADDAILELTEPVYDATLKAFSSKKELKRWIAGVSVWKFNASVFTNTPLEQREDASKQLVQMYTNLDALTFARIMDARSGQNRTKAEIVHEILKTALEKMDKQLNK